MTTTKTKTLTITLTLTGNEEQARSALVALLDAGVLQDSMSEHVVLVDGRQRFEIVDTSVA